MWPQSVVGMRITLSTDTNNCSVRPHVAGGPDMIRHISTRGLSGFVRVCRDMSGCVGVCRGLSGCVGMCRGLSEFVGVCRAWRLHEAFSRI